MVVIAQSYLLSKFFEVWLYWDIHQVMANAMDAWIYGSYRQAKVLEVLNVAVYMFISFRLSVIHEYKPACIYSSLLHFMVYNYSFQFML